MKKYSILVALIFLSGCAATEKKPEISRPSNAALSGMTYNEFRSRELTHGSDGSDIQKRFLALDRNGNGRLSANELGNF